MIYLSFDIEVILGPLWAYVAGYEPTPAFTIYGIYILNLSYIISS
jgi:hypothetical protein